MITNPRIQKCIVFAWVSQEVESEAAGLCAAVLLEHVILWSNSEG